jgi:hypothetical protein
MPEPLKPSSFRFYRGRSMGTAFAPGDCLYFEAVEPSKLRRGDVVIFRREQPGGEDVVHRVIDVCDGHLLARGDDNPPDMIDMVPFSTVLGRVTSFEHCGRGKTPVAGGAAGMLRAGLVAREGIPRRLARRAYSCLRKSGIVRLFWRPGIDVVTVATDGPSVVRLVSGGRTIGKWCRERRLLSLRKPYDLVVRMGDVSHL